MVLVDLATRIIPKDRQVVVARPGAQYRLAGAFIQGRVVGPDLPDLDWSNDDDGHIQVAKIKRSNAIRKWYRVGRPPHARPSLDLEEYDGFNRTPSSGQFLRVVRYYFETAKRGDLVVIPPLSFAGDARIGEYTGNPENTVEYQVDRYDPSVLMGRRVKWLGAMPKKALPGIVLESLRKPTAIVLVPRSFLSKIYQEAYGSFSVDGKYVAQFDVSSEKYTISDDINALGFFKFVAVNYRQIDSGARKVLSIQDAAFEDAAKYTPDLTTEINSPGFLTIASQYLVPLVASALFALAVEVGPEAYGQVEAGTLTIGNSAAPSDDPCALQVQEHIYDYMRLLGADRWARACEIARGAAEGSGLKSQATVKDDE